MPKGQKQPYKAADSESDSDELPVVKKKTKKAKKTVQKVVRKPNMAGARPLEDDKGSASGDEEDDGYGTINLETLSTTASKFLKSVRNVPESATEQAPAPGRTPVTAVQQAPAPARTPVTAVAAEITNAVQRFTPYRSVGAAPAMQAESTLAYTDVNAGNYFQYKVFIFSLKVFKFILKRYFLNLSKVF
jgi:hypothetical protein